MVMKLKARQVDDRRFEMVISEDDKAHVAVCITNQAWAKACESPVAAWDMIVNELIGAFSSLDNFKNNRPAVGARVYRKGDGTRLRCIVALKHGPNPEVLLDGSSEYIPWSECQYA